MKRRKFLTVMGLGAAAGAASGSAAAFLKGMPPDIPKKDVGGLQLLNEAADRTATEQAPVLRLSDRMTSTGHHVRCIANDERNQKIADQITELLRKDVAETMEKAMHDCMYTGTGMVYWDEIDQQLVAAAQPMVKFRTMTEAFPSISKMVGP